MTIWLFRCEYREEVFRKAIDRALSRILLALDSVSSAFGLTEAEFAKYSGVYFFRAMMAFVPKLKHACFAEEKEWRLVAFPHPGHESVIEYRACAKRGVVPFVTIPVCAPGSRLDLSDVYIGPTQDAEAACKTAQLYLRSLGYTNVDEIVKGSRMTYRG